MLGNSRPFLEECAPIVRVAALLVVLALAGCSPVEKRVVLDQAQSVELVAGIGDVMLRADVKEDLPNLWGRADLYGRTREASRNCGTWGWWGRRLSSGGATLTS